MKKVTIFIVFALLLGLFVEAKAEDPKTGKQGGHKHRLIILADMGNEADEMQQMVHMLIYNNEFDLEGLLAVSGKYLHPGLPEPYRQKLHPELFHELIDAYEDVLPNLKLHAEGWHEPSYLRSIVAEGQKGYGIDATGEGMESAGSKIITSAVLKDDPRPIYVVINAGANTLAQALRDYRATHTPEEMETFVKKLIVYENGSQDDAGAWIAHEFPSIHWIRSNHQTYGYMGTNHSPGPHVWKPYPFTNQGQHQWAKENVQTGHGVLGSLYPNRGGGRAFLEGGGTTPWLGLITRGLYDPMQPHWGGWSGRYTREKQKNVLSHHKDIAPADEKHTPFFVFADATDLWTFEGTTYNNHLTAIQRWRGDILENFKARMDWCVKPYKEANHNPVASINGDSDRTIRRVRAKPGECLIMDASGSTDPDAGQVLSFKWWIYPEAGTYEKPVPLQGINSLKCELTIPDDASGKQIHLILEVADDSQIAVMRDYRRIVFDIE